MQVYGYEYNEVRLISCSYLDSSIHVIVDSGEGVALVFNLLVGRSAHSSDFCKICFSSNIMPGKDP